VDNRGVVQQTSLTGRAVQWVGPPQRSWVVRAYWQEILALPPNERRQPRDDERPVLATGTYGTVGELVDADSNGDVYALIFPAGDHTYEIETELPQNGRNPLARLLGDDPS
jgi:hypothetical protein